MELAEIFVQTIGQFCRFCYKGYHNVTHSGYGRRQGRNAFVGPRGRPRLKIEPFAKTWNAEERGGRRLLRNFGILEGDAATSAVYEFFERL